ncbi:MAG: zinc-dependent metalloprotease [Phycisphaeraceae bacterium]|nr:zinc-dependent metalloprotease [Phycisphaeraceae bacterium]
MARNIGRSGACLLSVGALMMVCGTALPVMAQDASSTTTERRDEFRPWAEVSRGYEKVVSTADGASFYNLWKKDKDGSMLAELPRGYDNQKHFIALTVATGQEYAGLQSGDLLVYWKRIDNRMVLMEPNLGTRSTGDQESRLSLKNLFTDRVILDLPIVCMGPSNQPVIDMKDLLVGRATTFYGGQAAGGNPRLATIRKAKAFPENIEIAYEMPVAGGRLRSFHYSISLLKSNPSYKPRVADPRVGYFTTVHRDLGKFSDGEKWVRYINRWHVEKKDAGRKMSPPKEPIVFYIDAAVPARYRRFVRDGILVWNKAFERVGIIDAIEVRQQDAETGAYMDLDPEDVRYNFIRWLANDQGTAIGPSRVNPYTGQILDADVILTDGWIRHFWVQYNQIMPELAMEGLSAETMAWLDSRPQWDPRLRMAEPAQRDYILAQRMRRGVLAYGGHPIAMTDPSVRNSAADPSRMMGTHEFDGLTGRISQVNGLCLAARGKSLDMAYARMAFELMRDELDPEPEPEGDGGEKKDEKGDKPARPKKDAVDLIDGIPDWFVGPLLADLVQHEVGHTIGLRHNFKASAQYTLDQINSDEIKGQKAFTASVMDYTPVNFPGPDGVRKGDVAMIDMGKYDMWAIEYGYTFGDPKEVAKRSAEEGHDYGTDEDVGGPDPSIQRYDFSKNPVDYANSQMELARYHRTRLVDKFVKDGESWSKVRRGYNITLSMQTRSLTMLTPWIGGSFVNRDFKGDPNGRPPIQVVPVEMQRSALNWVIDNSFHEDSFGLTPEILERMTVDKWLDAGGFGEARQENTWPVHDRIAGIQSMVMTRLINPTTLRRVLDNEYTVPSDQDMLTLPELLDSISNAAWSELEKAPAGNYTARKPYITSMRRNLQREHLERMIDLTLPGAGTGESYKAISNLAIFRLRALRDKIVGIIGEDGTKSKTIDPYSLAHLSEAKVRIGKALDAGYIYNAGSTGGGFPFFMLFGQQPQEAAPTMLPYVPSDPE